MSKHTPSHAGSQSTERRKLASLSTFAQRFCAPRALRAPRTLGAVGHRCAILPLTTVATICDRETRERTRTLRTPVRPGCAWCLLFGRDLADEHVLTVPVTETPNGRLTQCLRQSIDAVRIVEELPVPWWRAENQSRARARWIVG